VTQITRRCDGFRIPGTSLLRYSPLLATQETLINQRQGASLSRELVARLIQIARAEQIHTIIAHILSQNAPMLAPARRFHFTSAPSTDPASHTAILHLD